MSKKSKIIQKDHTELNINNEIDALINKTSTFKEGTLKNFNDRKFYKNLKINSLVTMKFETKFLKQNLKTPNIKIDLTSNIVYYSYYDENHFVYYSSKKAPSGVAKVLLRIINVTFITGSIINGI
ncbi:hypothetical protein [Borrelia sp. P9F1]|uniref:hypothetical protein n=1 Tax=Borrelia sp. P9F1 TaxID=3058374 RepID=UPI0026499D16|nr:hypothetical protein [Borrelia sp. P9F1]WKC58291.1 hypothetical protein QYZ68_03920 [Borrelia sp. P9F1]